MTLFTSERHMKFNLTRLSALLAVTLLFVTAAMAAPTCPTNIAGTNYPLINGGLGSFVCDINNLEFSNFRFTSANLSPTGMVISPITTPGFEGLDFSGFALAAFNPGEVADLTVKFTVTALTGLLTDVHIDLLAPSVSGTGHVRYSETVCQSTSDCILFVDDPLTTSLTTSLILNPGATHLDITKDVTAFAGANGSAVVSDFDNYYSHTVPEPRAISIGLGLVLFGVVAYTKRRQAVRS